MESITNQAHVSFSYEGTDVIQTNDSNVVTSSMKDKYSLTVEKTSSNDCFRAGETIAYFVRITNTGCGCLSDFRIEDNIGGEDYTTYVEGSAKLFMNGTMTDVTPTSTSPLVFELDGRLERDEELILQYSVMVNSDISSDVNEITNHVEVTAYPCNCGCKSHSECVHECAELTIPKCEFAEVLITKAVSNDNVCCDEEIDYMITLTNIGNVDATNVVVTDQLPDNFTLTEVHKENNGNHYKYDASEYTLDGTNLLTLPNETGTIIEVPALAPGTDNTTRIRLHGHM